MRARDRASVQPYHPVVTPRLDGSCALPDLESQQSASIELHPTLRMDATQGERPTKWNGTCNWVILVVLPLVVRSRVIRVSWTATPR